MNSGGASQIERQAAAFPRAARFIDLISHTGLIMQNTFVDRRAKSRQRVSDLGLWSLAAAFLLFSLGCGGGADAPKMVDDAATTATPGLDDPLAAAAPNAEDETDDLGNADAAASSPNEDDTVSSSQAPAITTSTSVSVGRNSDMSSSDLELDDGAAKSGEPAGDAAAEANRDADPTESSPAVAAAIPQAVLDAPVQKYLERYDDGETPRRMFMAKTFEGGKILYHGQYIEYRPDGAKFKYGRYEYGKKVGEWTFWNTSGKVAKVGEYRNDNPEGEWKIYREDGSLNRIERYRDGLAHGAWVAFQDDGEAKLWERTYRDGKPDGQWLDFGSEGRFLQEVNFRAGQQHGPMRKWYDNGQLEFEGHFVDGKRHGTFRRFSQTGDVRDQVEWENGTEKVVASL